MSTPKFQPGEIVNVVIKGVRVTGDQGPRDTLTIADEHGTHYVMPPQAAIERAAPPGWPPQARDVWKDHDKDLWLACDDGEGGPDITMVCSSAGAIYTPDQVAKRFSPLALAYREEGGEDQ